MKFFTTTTRLLSIGVMALGMYAQSQSAQPPQSGQGADRQQNESSMTGCLNKDAQGGYTLADEKTGTKTAVTGTPDLEKHSANHKVTLTGTSKMDSGKSVFTVTKIQHISTDCKAGAQ